MLSTADQMEGGYLRIILKRHNSWVSCQGGVIVTINKTGDSGVSEITVRSNRIWDVWKHSDPNFLHVNCCIILSIDDEQLVITGGCHVVVERLIRHTEAASIVVVGHCQRVQLLTVKDELRFRKISGSIEEKWMCAAPTETVGAELLPDEGTTSRTRRYTAA